MCFVNIRSPSSAFGRAAPAPSPWTPVGAPGPGSAFGDAQSPGKAEKGQRPQGVRDRTDTNTKRTSLTTARDFSAPLAAVGLFRF